MKHIETLKIKDKIYFWSKLYFRQYYITRKIDLHGSVRGLRIQIRMTQKDRIRIHKTVKVKRTTLLTPLYPQYFSTPELNAHLV